METTPSSSCSRSDPPLSHQGAALAHLDPLLMNCYSGQTALFLFLLEKAAPAFLPTALSVVTLSVSAGPVCSSFSAEACAIHAFYWSWQNQQVCHFSSILLLSESRSVLATLSSLPSFLLYQTQWQIWQELSSLSYWSIRLQLVTGHSFLPGSNVSDELARWGALLAPSAIPCSLSYPFLSFLGLKAYCLIKILRHTNSLNFHRGTCAPPLGLLCPLWSTLKRTQPSIKLLSF